MIGTRGVPAHYGGFETAIEEIGSRLAARGEEVIVFCRPVEGEPRPKTYRGMQLIWLPALKKRSLETLSHTALSVLHPGLKGVDAAIVFNAANAPFLPLLKMRGIPVATHVDGLEWRRSKWGAVGRRYYRTMESYAVRSSNAIIADAAGIADYYRHEFGASSKMIAYGAPHLSDIGHDRLGDLGLAPDAYHLVVARFEPENHVLEIVQGYVASGATLPLVVVGSAPYSDEYSAAITQAADDRVRLLGGVWDQELLDQLYFNAATYLHGHSVGGTNPSLLRAAGAGTPTIAFDSVFNRGVIGETGWYFRTPAEVADRINMAEADETQRLHFGVALKARAAAYDWDQVADDYLQLCRDLARGYRAPRVSGRRSRPGWNDEPASSALNDHDAMVVAHPSPDLYGSDRVLLETLSSFAASGQRVVLTLPESGPLVSEAVERGVDVQIRRSPILRKSALTLGGAVTLLRETIQAWGPSARLLRESSARTLLVNTVTIPLWLLVGKRTGVRVVCHVHEAEANQPAIVRRVLYAPLILADRVIVNSNFTLSVVISAWRSLKGRTSVVYNGVQGPAEVAPARREIDSPLKVVFVGRLSPRKGADLLLDAVALLRDRGIDVEAEMVGDVFPGYEWYETELRDRSAELGLSDRISFAGFQSSVWPALARADVAVVPSRSDESFGNVVIEAALSGRPVVVADHSGLREASSGLEAAIRIRPDDPAALADGLARVMDEWPIFRQAAMRDAQFAQEQYSPVTYQRRMADAMTEPASAER